MSSNHTVEIRITAQNLSSPEFQSLLNDLKQVGAASQHATAQVQSAGSAARSAGGGFGEVGTAARAAGSGFLSLASQVGLTATGIWAIGQLVMSFAGTAAHAVGSLLSMNAPACSRPR